MKQSTTNVNSSLSTQLKLFSSKFPKIPKNLFLLLITLLLLILFTDKNSAFSIRDVLVARGGKRTASGGGEELVQCPTWHPFQCPNSECIPIKYLCDGSPDCSDEYDENSAMCTAAIRPPVEETVAFLKALLQAHGKDFLEKLFGEEARNSLAGMGGVDKVAVALSQSPTLEAFGVEMKMSPTELGRMASVLQAIASSDENSGFTPNEAADFRFFVQKLQETGFF
ncbi:unnamed protein product [Meloidogyne enterolobii]|uniref:Uncharacterized protein n=4 Tax=Meloidogyne TaxID=189290 RepID=A0A6V7U713_MELEN|nr:unnamed protein product [Meloidogyne enterolobii]CAD2162861.1 unnamed protein product [Meloidogyne enterolobii]